MSLFVKGKTMLLPREIWWKAEEGASLREFSLNVVLSEGMLSGKENTRKTKT
jgi:hypothetical protein